MDTSIALFNSAYGWVVVREIIRFGSDRVQFTGRLADDLQGFVGVYVADPEDLKIVHSHA